MHLFSHFLLHNLLKSHLFELSFLVKPLLVLQKLVYVSLLFLIRFFIVLTVSRRFKLL
jgi:hypothetical protein